MFAGKYRELIVSGMGSEGLLVPWLELLKDQFIHRTVDAHE